MGRGGRALKLNGEMGLFRRFAKVDHLSAKQWTRWCETLETLQALKRALFNHDLISEILLKFSISSFLRTVSTLFCIFLLFNCALLVFFGCLYMYIKRKAWNYGRCSHTQIYCCDFSRWMSLVKGSSVLELRTTFTAVKESRHRFGPLVVIANICLMQFFVQTVDYTIESSTTQIRENLTVGEISSEFPRHL